ncbi:unnamed protein product [Durusdinium trenchii]|uniref:Uncharacterized protein n=1 Tax=Durusdinium trenchii TaxID=1381693 RepID=A0ABP0I3J0_9DINO
MTSWLMPFSLLGSSSADRLIGALLAFHSDWFNEQLHSGGDVIKRATLSYSYRAQCNAFAGALRASCFVQLLQDVSLFWFGHAGVVACCMMCGMWVEAWLSPSILKVSHANASFPSPLDTELRNFALRIWQEEGLSRSNRGGWHSRYLDVKEPVLSGFLKHVENVSRLFLQKWDGDQTLREAFSTRVQVAALWVNVHGAGHYNVEHQHAQAGFAGDDIPLLSGVYYPRSLEGRHPAKLHFADCNGFLPQLRCSVDPDPGTMVLFPSTLPHSVQPANPSSSDSQQALRISFAFNLIVRSTASKLHAAAMTGNLERLKELLVSTTGDGPDPDHAMDLQGFSPLHHAAEAGHIEAVKSLLQSRANPLAPSTHQSLPVHLGAEAGHHAVVKEFLRVAPDVASHPGGTQNRTLVHIAAANGHTDLLLHLHNLHANFYAQQADGSSALHSSVQNGHAAATELILKHFPSLVNEADLAGHEAAHEAARGGSEHILRSLLRARAHTHSTAQDSLTYWAAHGGHTNTLELLFSELGFPKSQDNAFRTGTAKSEAVANYLAAALIGTGNNPQMKKEELSLMHVAARDGHLKVAEWLGQRGFSSTPATSSQLLPIHVAASSGHVDVTRWLSRDVSATARGNITPLHMAALNGHSVVAQSLLALQAEPLAAATDGSQPLHVAAAAGHVELAELLLGARAQVDAPTRKKHVPLHRAKEAGHGSLVELLLKYSAEGLEESKHKDLRRQEL